MRSLLRFYSLASRPVCALKAMAYARRWKRPLRAPLPVVSVGNLSLGGAGKTPVVMRLVAWAEGRGLEPAVVTRGYKGLWERSGGVLSDGKDLRGGWREAGDEPAMIARRFPRAGVFVGRHRFLSCQKARQAGFDFVLLDDGFQHVRLARDLDIVLHHPGLKAALREGPGALRRADVVLIETDSGREVSLAFRGPRPGPAVFPFQIRPEAVVDLASGALSPPESLRGKRVLAVCGIARPERFFLLLDKLGLEVTGRMLFPDHFDFPPRVLAEIAAKGARLRPEAFVTTEKDAVKLEAAARSFRLPVLALRIGVVLPEAFFQVVGAALAKAENGHA